METKYMSNNCNYFTEQINDYIDGNLDDNQKTELEKHINICNNCAQELKELKLTVIAIRNLQNIKLPDAKETFSKEIIQQLNADNPAIISFRTPWIKYAAASISVLVIAGLMVFTFWGPISKPVATNQPTNEEIVEYQVANEFYEVIEENVYYDNSIIADAGFPTDEWGLLDVDGL